VLTERLLPSRLVTLAAFIVVAMALQGPVQAVRAADGPNAELIRKGAALFRTAGGVGCAACHGPYAEGDLGIGPYNRGVGEFAIRSALQSVEPMAFLKEEMTDANVKAIAAYYKWLGSLQLTKTLVKRGRFIPAEFSIYPGTAVQLVLNNSSTQPHTFASENMRVRGVKIAGRTSADVVWTAPTTEGVFTLGCTDCDLKEEKLTIKVTKAAKPFIRVRIPAQKVASVPQKPEAAPAATARVATAPRDESMIRRGREVFLTAGGVGCVACHGPYAEGDVGIGPYNRGFKEKAIRAALGRVAEMKFLHDELTDTEIRQVAAYYESLGEEMLVKTRVVRGHFIPSKIRIRPGTKVQLVVNNRDPDTRRFTASSMTIDDFVVPGRSDFDVVWSAPDKEGEYIMSCINCTLKGQHLVVEVTSQAPVFTPPEPRKIQR